MSRKPKTIMSSTTKPNSKSNNVYVSRQFGKYRVGGHVSDGWAIFLAGGPLLRLAFIALVGFGIYNYFTTDHEAVKAKKIEWIDCRISLDHILGDLAKQGVKHEERILRHRKAVEEKCGREP